MQKQWREWHELTEAQRNATYEGFALTIIATLLGAIAWSLDNDVGRTANAAVGLYGSIKIMAYSVDVSRIK